jgi:hypothetical protein
MTELSPQLKEFWQWISRADLFASVDSIVDHYDFRWRGVLSLINGFAPDGGSTSRHKSYPSAVSSLVSRRGASRLFSIPSSIKDERQVALFACGRDWEVSFAVASARYEEAGDHEAGARHAFLSGHLDRATKFLSRSGDERLRLIAPVLASYLIQAASGNSDQNGIFSDVLSSLASESLKPWIRGTRSLPRVVVFCLLAPISPSLIYCLAQLCSLSYPVEIGETSPTKQDYQFVIESPWH